LRKWKDLSFLELQSSESESDIVYGIHDASISFALCGIDHWRWTAFAFVDTAFDDHDLQEDLRSYEAIQPDPITSNLWIMANRPIWDPREYFLMAFNVRMAQVGKEWQYVVRKVEQGIKQYVCLSAIVSSDIFLSLLMTVSD
jgi:hypothetical protein